jgi:hypothetical protein
MTIRNNIDYFIYKKGEYPKTKPFEEYFKETDFQFIKNLGY